MLLTIAAFVFVLSIVVFVHEGGHFVAAKLNGIYVVTFSIGFGPKLIRKRIGETEYAISALPFGGYVKMAGEQEHADGQFEDKEGLLADVPEEKYYRNKNPWQRMTVVLAGPLMNAILALAPDNPVALNNMAYLLAGSPSSLDTALTLAQRAIGRAPGNPTIMDTLGWIYLKKNLSDNAIQIYQELAGRFPAEATWRYHLAMALFQKGDKPQARRELRTALRNHPTKAEETKIRNLLSQLGG
jgi:hypothetical protein